MSDKCKGEELRQTLKNILSSRSPKKAKIFLLTSFREQLRLTFKTQLQANIHQNTLKRAKTSCIMAHLSENQSTKSDIVRNDASCIDQQNQRKTIINTISKFYKEQERQNQHLFHIQKYYLNTILQKQYHDITRPETTLALDNDHEVNKKLKKVFLELEILLSKVKTHYEVLNDFTKIIKVKYIQKKEEERRLKKSIKLIKGKIETEQLKMSKKLNDENHNQILVNL